VKKKYSEMDQMACRTSSLRSEGGGGEEGKKKGIEKEIAEKIRESGPSGRNEESRKPRSVFRCSLRRRKTANEGKNQKKKSSQKHTPQVKNTQEPKKKKKKKKSQKRIISSSISGYYWAKLELVRGGKKKARALTVSPGF